ncbi:MAG: DUF3179 domain-containing protein [Bacteroidales bacterium]|nr:DUF3179 domain-containing protein [Bacteroidales bacterium]
MLILYIIAFISLIIGMGAVFTLIEKFPVKLLYYHYRIRKPLIWIIFTGVLVWQILISTNGFSVNSIPPLLIIGLAVIMTYKVHQSTWFKAINFPKMTSETENIPLSKESQLAVIEINGIIKAYPLDFVIHHHIVNDKFNETVIALTYCAMCRSIIPFDVTEIGPLFVASFKNANMVVADKKTKTFFQQASFNSIIGKLHPYTLKMISFQILSWEDVKKLKPVPKIAVITENDLRSFKLPIPGVWKKVMSTELTPGLSNKDKTFPSKMHVIGIIDASVNPKVVYLKSEVLSQKVLRNDDLCFTLISTGKTVNGFKNKVGTHEIYLSLKDRQTITDSKSETTWDLTGKYIGGIVNSNLEPLAISDEYWFSWKNFHPESNLIRISNS